ncbi:hypothetical protein [Actinomadura sp. NPDC048394]|uniref:hypothetical protein n=1 Tax=Actinomadura sp. NPDC048394 TaxID=3158223 RepID=UPI0033F39971
MALGAAAGQQIEAQFHQFVDHTPAYGYNGVVLPGFLEYIGFGGVGGGHAAHRAAMRAAFGQVWRYAHDMGMKVHFQTAGRPRWRPFTRPG